MSKPSRPDARPLPRARLFALLCAVCLIAAGGYVGLAMSRKSSGLPATAAATPAPAAAPPERPYLVARSTTLGDTYGKVILAPLEPPDAPRYTTSLECDRVDFAGQLGICLASEPGVLPTFHGYLFDADFQPRHPFPVNGLPSRARLAPDGRSAAATVFVTGDSYAGLNFSTRTTLLDTASGEARADLEQFMVLRDGARIQAADFNFWGVTFARDSNRFYATLGTAGTAYLVEGDLEAHQARVIAEQVECPSLSPDNTRIAFKRRHNASGGQIAWQLYLLELATLEARPLAAERRSVDDQVQWLDDGHIMYALRDEAPAVSANPVTNVWVLPVDGSGPPRILLPGASSPSVVR